MLLAAVWWWWATAASWCSAAAVGGGGDASAEATVSVPFNEALREYEWYLAAPRKTLVNVSELNKTLEGKKVTPPGVILYRCPVTLKGKKCDSNGVTGIKLTIEVLIGVGPQSSFSTINAINHTECRCPFDEH